MLRGRSGAISSVIHAALRAPPDAPARISLEIISEVVDVNTNRSTFAPGDVDSSSRVSVPCTFTATKSAPSCVPIFGLWSAPEWMTASTPRSHRIDADDVKALTLQPRHKGPAEPARGARHQYSHVVA